MTSVKQALVAVAVTAGVMLVLAGMVAAVRAGKKGGPGMAVIGSVLLLTLGGALAPQRPEQGVEEAREDKQKKGSESGDPPADEEG
ncbi:MAG TPA: hypothetical protein VGM84_05695 [Steroidobacteraceae bacterium]|jgi:hypothetical protein